MMAMQGKRRMPDLIVLLVIIFLILGYIGYGAINRVADLTTELYNHLYTVSTAVLRINTNVISMQQNMKDLLLAATPEELRAQFDNLRENQEALDCEKLLTEAFFDSVSGMLLPRSMMRI